MAPTQQHSKAARLVVAALTSCLLVLGACGDDDSEAGASTAAGASTSEGSASETAETPPTTAAPQTSADPSSSAAATTAAPTTEVTEPSRSAGGTDASTDPALCEPYLQVSAAFAAEPDPATIGVLLDRVDAAAPTDIAEHLAVLTDLARTVLETGDLGVFERPDFAAAITAADAWVFENCEFVTTTQIVAAEYRYEGQSGDYPAGRTAFALVNEGAEAHELVIIRKNDGVELTLEKLMDLPEADAETMTTYVGAAFVGPPGARSNLVVDLTPGNYIAVCNIPAGTIVAEDGSFTEGTGQPHVMLGMSFEFTVT